MLKISALFAYAAGGPTRTAPEGFIPLDSHPSPAGGTGGICCDYKSRYPFASPTRRAVLRGQRQRDLSLWTPIHRLRAGRGGFAATISRDIRLLRLRGGRSYADSARGIYPSGLPSIACGRDGDNIIGDMCNASIVRPGWGNNGGKFGVASIFMKEGGHSPCVRQKGPGKMYCTY